MVKLFQELQLQIQLEKTERINSVKSILVRKYFSLWSLKDIKPTWEEKFRDFFEKHHFLFFTFFILQNAVRIFSSENPHHSCCNKKAFFKSLLTTIWLKKFLWHANINWVTYHNTLPSKSLYSGHLDKIIRNLLHCYGWKILKFVWKYFPVEQFCCLKAIRRTEYNSYYKFKCLKRSIFINVTQT